MEKRTTEYEINSILKPVCAALGLVPVEISVRRQGDLIDFSVVIYKEGGVSTEDCVRLHQTLFLKLQTMFQKKIGLEISSPGLDRTFKYEDELGIFLHRRVRWMEKGSSDYQNGVIRSFDGNTVVFFTDGGEEKHVPVGDILKAKLNG